MNVYFASHNQNKVKEIASLAPKGITILSLDELGVNEEIPETGQTMEENSRIKASYVHSSFNVPVFADDSGLEVDALNGEPGVYSARYAGSQKNDEDNIDLLLKKMEGRANKSARFKCVITYIDNSGEEIQFTGVVEGKIGAKRKGTNGFGYDPVFTPEGFDRTFAEMTDEEKNKISHRARAFKQLINHFQGLNE